MDEQPIYKRNGLKEAIISVVKLNTAMNFIGYGSLVMLKLSPQMALLAFFSMLFFVPLLLFINLTLIASTIVIGIRSGSILDYMRNWGFSGPAIGVGITSSLLFYLGASLFFILVMAIFHSPAID